MKTKFGLGLLVALQIFSGTSAFATPLTLFAPQPLAQTAVSRTEVLIPEYDAEKGILWNQARTISVSDVDLNLWAKQALTAIDDFIERNPSTIDPTPVHEARLRLIDVISETGQAVLTEPTAGPDHHSPRELLKAAMQQQLAGAFEHAGPALLTLPAPASITSQSIEYQASENLVPLTNLREALRYNYVAKYNAQLEAADRLEVVFAPLANLNGKMQNNPHDLVERLAQFVTLYPKIKAQFNGPLGWVAVNAMSEIVAPLPEAWRLWNAPSPAPYQPWMSPAEITADGIKIFNLDALAANSFQPSIRVVRNVSVSATKATNPAFVFVSPEAKFQDQLHPFVNLTSPVEIAKSGDTPISGGVAMSKLFNALLANTNPAGFTFQLEVELHQVVAPGIETILPVMKGNLNGSQLNPIALGDFIDSYLTQQPGAKGTLHMTLDIRSADGASTPLARLSNILLPTAALTPGR